MPVYTSDHRIHYGNKELQFGDLRLPAGPGPHPVAVVIHGGCWLSEYNLEHIGNSCANALTSAGIATWSLEYRRVGDTGGGWPGTFQDIAQGTEYIRELAQIYPIDVDRVIALGHSAGSHLALWLAAGKNLPEESPLRTSDPFPIKGVISLAGITDLRAYSTGAGDCNRAVAKLLGGNFEEMTGRYEQTSPIGMLPLGVPQRMIHGDRDTIVPLEQVKIYTEKAKNSGDDAEVRIVENAGHYELIAPQTQAFSLVRQAALELLQMQ
jgi:acetyl esterase/lipase